MATKPLLGPPVRLALQWGFLVWTFAAALHFNVVRPYLLRGRQLVGRSSIARASVRTYDGAMDAAEVVGMASIWRMYSPVPRHLRETRWEALDRSGRWVPVTSPGVSPARRRDRSLAAAVLWDFKRARVNDNYFVRRYLEQLPHIHVMASREAIAAELGHAPQALRVRVYRTPIPPPDEKGTWEPLEVVHDQVEWEQVYR